MVYCTSCGETLDKNANFCWNCGAKVAPASKSAEETSVYTGSAKKDEEGYSLVLMDAGKRPHSEVAVVLQNILRYTEMQAYVLMASVPAVFARNLTLEQARYLAQALTEWGMKVAAYRNGVAVDISEEATESVFEDDGGAFIGAAIAALAGIAGTSILTSFLFQPEPQVPEQKPIQFQTRYQYEPPRVQPKPNPFLMTEARPVSVSARQQQMMNQDPLSLLFGW